MRDASPEILCAKPEKIRRVDIDLTTGDPALSRTGGRSRRDEGPDAWSFPSSASPTP